MCFAGAVWKTVWLLGDLLYRRGLQVPCLGSSGPNASSKGSDLVVQALISLGKVWNLNLAVRGLLVYNCRLQQSIEKHALAFICRFAGCMADNSDKEGEEIRSSR